MTSRDVVAFLPEDAEVRSTPENMALLFAFTIIGFDGSPYTSEETYGASMAVPRGIIRAVAVSAIVGWLMLIAMVIAIPDMNTAVNQSSNVFFWLIDQVLPNWLRVVLLVGITITQYCCGIAMITIASRVIFVFSRDGGMPFSEVLCSLIPVSRTPKVAVLLSAILAVGFILSVPYIAVPPMELFRFHETPNALKHLIPPWEPMRAAEAPKGLQPGTGVTLTEVGGTIHTE